METQNKLQICPLEFGVEPNTGRDMTAAFRALFKKLSELSGEKLVVLQPGIYDFHAEFAEKIEYYISNTIGEKEVAKPERTVPLRLFGVQNLVLEGAGAEFKMHSAMTNFVIENCTDIEVRGLSFDHIRPAVTEVEVTEVAGFSAKFKINQEYLWKIEKNAPVFFGEAFRHEPTKNMCFQWANVILPAQDSGHIWRTHNHPFLGGRRFKKLDDTTLLVKYYWFPKLNVGDRYALHNTTRREVGIFVANSARVIFDGVKEYFNCAHGYIAQMSQDITIQNCWNAPREGSGRFTASQTDFCHFSMCSGKIIVQNNRFDGAFDDVFNAHGFHFKISKIEVDSIWVKFMHPQAYGFLPFEEGDKIEFVNADTLVPTKIVAVVQSLKMEDKYTINLVLDTVVPKEVSVGTMVENISKCPSVDFLGNKISHITTRGVLVTTRGAVKIADNDFEKTGMSGVLISDDAKSWYESGAVRNVMICGNRFFDCGEHAVLVLPEYRIFERPVHKNITIQNNDIVVMKGANAIRLKGAEDVIITANRISGSPSSDGFIVEKECKGVKIFENEIKA